MLLTFVQNYPSSLWGQPVHASPNNLALTLLQKRIHNCEECKVWGLLKIVQSELRLELCLTLQDVKCRGLAKITMVQNLVVVVVYYSSRLNCESCLQSIFLTFVN